MKPTKLKKMREDKIKVLIVDDHPVLRQGLKLLINQERDLTVCGEAEDAEQALQAIKTLKPNLAIVDLSLKKASGIELIKEIKNLYPRLITLVLSIHDESFYAERALRAGAKGYIMKQEGTETIVKAVHQVLKGEIYLSEGMSKKLLQTAFAGERMGGASSPQQLTDRELEVLRLVGKGFSTQEIADQIYLSVKTIETHHKNIREKLHLDSSLKLRQYAIQWLQSEETV